ncbi:MAG: hypothetical protein FJY88_01540 [Candidatus Eisenbacteria bacterium]|nr:hypothetical protein [Candidatus Eisenbacteria bacterium]
MQQLSLEFLSPQRNLWLLLVPVGVALAVWAYYRTVAPLERPSRTVLQILRGLAILIVLFALAEPVLTIVLPDPGKPRIALLIDGSASMALPGSGPAAGSRAERARDLAREIADRLGSDFRVDQYAFDSALAPRERDAPARSAGNTAIGDALDALASREGGRPLGGAILLSDGMNTVGSDPVGAARNAGVPVFPVMIGGSLGAPDVRVLRIRTNAVAFSGEPVPVEVEIASTGQDGRALDLEVVDQGKVLATGRVTVGRGEDLEQSVRLDVRPQAPGLRKWDVRLVGAQDAIPENDSRSVALRVLERKTRVLLLEGRLDWDHAFLRRVLASDSTFGYRFLLADRAGRWLPDRPGAPPPQIGDLRDYAAVVLGDAPASALGAGFHAALARYVEQGGGLLVLGGRAGLARLRGTPLEPLLPADVIPGIDQERPLAARLTTAGLTHPITAVEESPARAEAVWSSLPPVWPSPDRVRTRAGGVTLLEFAAAKGGEPALVAGFAGQGKVALLASHDFWRWGFLPSGTAAGGEADLFGQFALRLIRWLAEPTLRDRFLAEPARGVFQNGEAPEFAARVWDERYAPVPDARVTIRVVPASDASGGVGDSSAHPTRARVVDLRPKGLEGTFAGKVDPLQPGAYRFTAEAVSADGLRQLGRIESAFWVDQNGPEHVRLRSDPGTLDQIARASGGTAVDEDGLAALLARLPGTIRKVGRVREIEMWNQLAVFLAFILVLSVEWFLRRRRGLA